MGTISYVFSHALMAIIYVVPFLLVLGAVVFVHEYGHFIVGRWCGAKVEAFSIGMGPELLGYTDRFGTRWRLSAVPVGGYVRFAGDRNAASAPDDAALAQMTAAERGVTLAGQPVAKRAAIVAAGPAANFLMAIVVLSSLSYIFGETIVPPRIASVVAGSPAELAGFQKGDVITRIDNREIASFPDMFNYISVRPGETMTFWLERDGREMSIVATPALSVLQTPVGPQRVGRLGIAASGDSKDFITIQPSPLGALRSGLSQCWSTIRMTEEYVSRLIAGRATPDQLSGPVRIAQLSNVAASFGPVALINLAAILSLSLGLTNLLPAPMLDGGHLVFYAIEAVRGKPLSPRSQEFALRIGVAFVLVLTLLATFNDLWRLFSA